jgi:serine/threonine protein kinase
LEDTLFYRAPEVLMKFKEYSMSIDIWSLGCVLGEMFLGNSLFVGNNSEEVLFDIYKRLGHVAFEEAYQTKLSKEKYFPERGFEFIREKHPEFNEESLDLLNFIMKLDPEERPNCEEILQHPFFNGVH